MVNNSSTRLWRGVSALMSAKAVRPLGRNQAARLACPAPKPSEPTEQRRCTGQQDNDPRDVKCSHYRNPELEHLGGDRHLGNAPGRRCEHQGRGMTHRGGHRNAENRRDRHCRNDADDDGGDETRRTAEKTTLESGTECAAKQQLRGIREPARNGRQIDFRHRKRYRNRERAQHECIGHAEPLQSPPASVHASRAARLKASTSVVPG